MTVSGSAVTRHLQVSDPAPTEEETTDEHPNPPQRHRCCHLRRGRRPHRLRSERTDFVTVRHLGDDRGQDPVPSPSATATDAATPSSSPSQGPATSALAQHVYDECSKGAADAGVTLTFTDDPSGYPGSDGTYQLVYPFTFDDGHTDPYAMYNCTLTDDTVGSSYISSGMTDSH